MHLGIKQSFSGSVGDYLLSLASLGQFFLTALQNFLIDSGICSEELAGTLRVLGSAILVLISIYWIIRRKVLMFIGCYSILIILFFLSSAMNTENLEYILSDGVRITFCTVVPVFLSFISVYNMHIFYRTALFVSLATSVIGLLYLCYSLSDMLPAKDVYNMSIGYSLLFPSLFLYFTKRPFFIFIAILLFIVIFLEGSRGPLIPIACYILFQKLIGSSFKNNFIFLFVLLFSISTIINFQSFFIDLFEKMNLHSRTFALLISGEVSRDSGRGDIYNLMISKLFENPYWGYGVFGDRTLGDGSYCHNIFLEIMLNFGCFVPVLFILVFGALLVVILPKLKKNELIFFVLLSLSSILPLCLSGSYLTDFKFPLFLGYVYILRKKYMPIKVGVWQSNN